MNSIEINGSFYSLQKPETYLRWYQETPEDFLFAVKGNRYITHFRRLVNVEEPLANFFASGILLLEEKLGPLLWQFPPQLAFDPERFDSFLSALPRTTHQASLLASQHSNWMKDRSYTRTEANRELRHAIEVRNWSFKTPEFVRLLRRHRVGLVVADTATRWPYFEDVTADFVYLRLHGQEELYVSGYDDLSLDRWAERIRVWTSGKQCPDGVCIAPRMIDRKANRSGRDIYAYFDNDVKVRAPFDAMALLSRVINVRKAA